jgi:hypothetical protein
VCFGILAGLAGFIHIFASLGGFALGGGSRVGFWILGVEGSKTLAQNPKIQNPKSKS